MQAAPNRRPGPWLAVAAWLAGAATLLALDGVFDLANLALVAVLASSVAAFGLPGAASLAGSAVAVLAFNWAFVPPRHALSVESPQHLLMLAAMWAVSAIVTALLAAQRRAAAQSAAHAEAEQRLRSFSEQLRDAADPAAHTSALRAALAEVAAVPVAVLVRRHRDAGEADIDALVRDGDADAERAAGLWHCLRQGHALGPGSGRYEEQDDAYLPLRGRGASYGAAVLRDYGTRPGQRERLAHLQSLCDLMGLALQRADAAREETAARERVQAEQVRSTMLAAISHDFRTPLATIMSAASSLHDQAERLDAPQRQRLAQSIVDEAARLARLAENTLQLARLDGPGTVELQCDWQSAEEIVGAVLRRVRPRDRERRLRWRFEPPLPLVWCDALLLSQLLENLIDNALKHTPAESPVEVLVRRAGETIVFAVRDRGPGVAPRARERIFEPFRRGAEPMAGREAEPASEGGGVGLAVCRAIACAHGGTLRLRARGHGGSSFECALPVRETPAMPEEAA